MKWETMTTWMTDLLDSHGRPYNPEPPDETGEWELVFVFTWSSTTGGIAYWKRRKPKSR